MGPAQGALGGVPGRGHEGRAVDDDGGPARGAAAAHHRLGPRESPWLPPPQHPCQGAGEALPPPSDCVGWYTRGDPRRWGRVGEGVGVGGGGAVAALQPGLDVVGGREGESQA